MNSALKASVYATMLIVLAIVSAAYGERPIPIPNQVDARPVPAFDDVHPEPDQLCIQCREAVQLVVRPAPLDADVPPLDPAKVCETAPKRFESGPSPRGRGARREPADPAEPPGRLRLGGEQRREEAASDCREECPALDCQVGRECSRTSAAG